MEESMDIETMSKSYYHKTLADQNVQQSRQDQTDGKKRDLKNMDFQPVKIEVTEIKWTPTKPQCEYEGPTRRVTVKNQTGGADVFGHLQTSKESEMEVTVTLKSGIIKGYNHLMRLPLPEDVWEELGKSVKFNPSKRTSGEPDKMNISLTSGHDIPQDRGAATAIVTCKEKEYKGDFVCDVMITGDVIFKETDGSSTNTHVTEIFLEEPKHSEAVKDKNMHWKMEGSCALRWSFDQTVTWEKADNKGADNKNSS